MWRDRKKIDNIDSSRSRIKAFMLALQNAKYNSTDSSMTIYEPFLNALGWDDLFQKHFEEIQSPGLFPARIISQGRGHYHIQYADQGVVEASISSRLHKEAKSSGDFPTVGDWVGFTVGRGAEKATIQCVLPRRTSLQRKKSGHISKTQHLAANVDFMFIVTSLNEDFDLPRLGRYLDLGKGSGCEIFFVLTKADLCRDPQIYISQLKNEFGSETKFFLTSSKESASLSVFENFFAVGKTSVLLGSSGVGKSTLTNYFLGTDLQTTGSVSQDSRGRHTTTSRNLLVTRWGGLVIDTPGMQEVSALDSDDTDEASSFEDIEALRLQCRFTNCRHQNDPGCAVTAALKDKSLSTERWNVYLKAASKVVATKKKWQK